MKNIITLTSLVLLLLLNSCSGSSTNVDEEEEKTSSISISSEEMKKLKIEIGKIPVIPMEKSVIAQGMVDVPPTNKASVFALIKGNIRKVFVLPGEKVKKGQALATMYDIAIIQLQEDYLKSESQLLFLSQDLKRKEELASSNAIAMKELEKSQADYAAEKSTYQSLQNKLQLIGISPAYISKNGILSEINITSPIDGFIADCKINIGESVNENKLMFEVVDVSHLHVELLVPSKYISGLKEGQDCYFNFNSSNSEHHGKVHLIGKIANSENSTVNVHIHPDDASAFVIGTKLQGRIVIGVDTVPAVETNELLKAGDQYFIYVQNENVWNMTAVQIGAQNERYTEIMNEDLQDKTVVLKGNYYLSN